ncbi:MAG TPA: hypothetical protein VII73_10650 [Caulobacteraceae bacterium]
MIREERDPAFWYEIASHPALEGALMGLSANQVAETAMQASILPLASDNGGFFFGRMDALGLTVELHTVYRPAGWGREVSVAAKQAFTWVFGVAQVIVTCEVSRNHRSSPPRSFGFAIAGDWQITPIGRLRPWVLTRRAWETSPAHRRLISCR